MSKTTQTTKTATNKTARAPRASKVKGNAPEVKNEVQEQPAAPAAPAAPVLTYAQRLTDALRVRGQVSKDLDIAVSGIAKGAVTINLLHARSEWASVLESLLTLAPVGESRDPRFIAVKVWVKIVHFMQAVSAGVNNYADPYTRTLCYNIASTEGLTNKSALVSLSKSISYSETDQVQTLTRRYGCSVGTASTQASSTRMMLRALQVCEVTKGKNGDVIRTIDGNPRCDAMLTLFATKPAE